MKIYLASDHAGFDLKEKVKAFLIKKKFEVEDLGAFTFDKNDDYPDFISQAASAVSKNPQDKAIIFGGSGQGEAILANKYKNVRAALFYGPRVPKAAVDVQGNTSSDPFEMIHLSRQHNDANVLSLAARMLSDEEAMQAVALWLHTPFSDDPRHVRRIEKIKQIEKSI